VPSLAHPHTSNAPQNRSTPYILTLLPTTRICR
jgi:hypothetical protein